MGYSSHLRVSSAGSASAMSDTAGPAAAEAVETTTPAGTDGSVRGDAARPDEPSRSAYPGRPEPAWSHRPGLEVVAFPRTAWGHRGYEEASVDTFVEQAVRDRAAADEQISDLRAEVDRLHRYIRRQWAAVAAAESSSAQRTGRPLDDGALISPAAQARAVLSQAQEIADRRLAEADARLGAARQEADARLEHADRESRSKLMDADRQAGRLIGAGEGEAVQRLTRADAIAEQVLLAARQHAAARRERAQDDADRVLRSARSRYEDIVLRAHQRADRAAELALADFQAPRPSPAHERGRVRAELEMKAAYLRTFAKVSRGALRAELDVTAGEFDLLLGASEAAADEAPVPFGARPYAPVPFGSVPITSLPAAPSPDPGSDPNEDLDQDLNQDLNLRQAPDLDQDLALDLDQGLVSERPSPLDPLITSPRRAARAAQPRVIVLPDTEAAERAGVIRQS
jgi:hypothetical protein